MGDRDTILNALAEIQAQTEWLVRSVKYLLEREVRGAHVSPDDDFWDSLDQPAPVPVLSLDELRAAADADEDRLHPEVVRERPACPHNRQGILDGVLICLRCNTPLAASGVIQDRLSGDGKRIIHDPNPPMHRAGAFTREATQNGSLVPHHG